MEKITSQPIPRPRRFLCGSALHRFCYVLWAALLLPFSGLVAQGPSITASVDPPEIGPGGFAAYSIRITGGAAEEVSELNFPDGVELASRVPSYSSQTTITGGSMIKSFTWSWQITSERIGTYTIPAQELHINGRPYKSNETQLVVKEQAPNEAEKKYDPILLLETTKREIYVGEVIPISVKLYANAYAMLRHVGLIEVPKDNFAIQRFPTQAEEARVSMAGAPYRELTYHSSLSGLKPGKFTLGPAKVEIYLDIPQGQYQHPMLSIPSETKRLRPSSNDFTVTVLALPEQGKPKSFKGAVGDFEMSVTADPKELSIGEPITAVIRIKGTGNFDAVTAPTLTDPAPWKIYPSRRFQGDRSQDWPGGTQQIGFDQVLLPQKQVPSVPSYEFSYFSPTKKQYITLKSAPIPLKIKTPPPPVESVPSAAKGKELNATEPPIPNAPQAKAQITDIIAHIPGTSNWVQPKPPLWEQRNFLIANAGAAGFLLILLLGKWGYVAWVNHLHAPDAPARKLWKQLHADGIPRSQFYSLAAAYAAAKGKHGPEIEHISQQYYQLNYSVPNEESQAPIPAEEKQKVLTALHTLS